MCSGVHVVEEIWLCYKMGTPHSVSDTVVRLDLHHLPVLAFIDAYSISNPLFYTPKPVAAVEVGAIFHWRT